MIYALIKTPTSTSLLINEGIKSFLDQAPTLPDFFRSQTIADYESMRDCPISTGKMLIGGSHTYKMSKDNSFDVDRVFAFFSAYSSALSLAFATDPENYTGSIGDTYSRMCYAILDGSFNKGSQPFKSACKVLKIKHTYKAINAYLRGE